MKTVVITGCSAGVGRAAGLLLDRRLAGFRRPPSHSSDQTSPMTFSTASELSLGEYPASDRVYDRTQPSHIVARRCGMWHD
jgi:hypothetical protein